MINPKGYTVSGKGAVIRKADKDKMLKNQKDKDIKPDMKKGGKQ